MRIGIFGGTFNPIHTGHLILAESAREQYKLDRVLFIPTANPPHKSSRGLLDGAKRLQLIRLAIRDNPAFAASDIELRRGGISYSLYTVREIRRRFPRARLFFLVGSDMLHASWVGLGELRRLCTFIVGDRATVPISSSEIRARIRGGRSIRYLVPDRVAAAIARRRWYR